MLKDLITLYVARTPACVVGTPGVGKSQILMRFAEYLKPIYPDITTIILSGATLTPELLGGVVCPDRTRRFQRRLAPAWIKRTVIVFVDEANLCPRSVEDSIRQLVESEPKVCGRKLRPGSWVCLAMNPPGLGGDRPLSLALRNRVCIIPWSWSTDSLADYLLGGHGLESDVIDIKTALDKYAQVLAVYRGLVASWVKSQSQREWELAAKNCEPHANFPSPRSIEAACRIIAACHACYPDDRELPGRLLVGTVGKAAAAGIADAIEGFDPCVLLNTDPTKWGDVIDSRVDRARAQIIAAIQLPTPVLCVGLQAIAEKFPELVVFAVREHLLHGYGSPSELTPEIRKFLR